MRKQLYLDIKERLETIKDASNEPFFRHIDMWNRQVEFIMEEQPFDFPAILIEYGDMNWRTLGNRVQECELTVRLHVLTKWGYPNANYSTAEYHALNSFDDIDKVVAGMQGFSTEYMNSWMRKTSITDHDHGEVIESIEEYACTLHDYSAVKQYVAVNVEQLKIEEEL